MDRVDSLEIAGGTGQAVPRSAFRVRVPRSGKDLLNEALDRAKDALTKENCKNLFGTEKSWSRGFDPATVLQSLADGGKFGSIKFENKGATWGPAGASPVWKQFMRKVTITINTFDGGYGYWNNASLDMNAHTLLHELGHAFDLLRKSGGSDVKSPDAGPWSKRGRENDYLIDQNCFGGGLGFKKP